MDKTTYIEWWLCPLVCLSEIDICYSKTLS